MFNSQLTAQVYSGLEKERDSSSTKTRPQLSHSEGKCCPLSDAPGNYTLSLGLTQGVVCVIFSLPFKTARKESEDFQISQVKPIDYRVITVRCCGFGRVELKHSDLQFGSPFENNIWGQNLSGYYSPAPVLQCPRSGTCAAHSGIAQSWS